MYRKPVCVFLFVFFLFAVCACSGMQTTKPYEVVKVTSEEILFQARVFQNQGVITEAEFLQVKNIYDKVRAAQDVVIDARLALIKVNSAANQDKVNVAAAELTKLSAELIALAAQLGIGGVR